MAARNGIEHLLLRPKRSRKAALSLAKTVACNTNHVSCTSKDGRLDRFLPSSTAGSAILFQRVDSCMNGDAARAGGRLLYLREPLALPINI